MNESIVIGLLVLVFLCVCGLFAVAGIALATLRRKSEIDHALITRLTNAVTATSDWQLARMQIESGVSTDRAPEVRHVMPGPVSAAEWGPAEDAVRTDERP